MLFSLDAVQCSHPSVGVQLQAGGEQVDAAGARNVVGLIPAAEVQPLAHSCLAAGWAGARWVRRAVAELHGPVGLVVQEVQAVVDHLEPWEVETQVRMGDGRLDLHSQDQLVRMRDWDHHLDGRWARTRDCLVREPQEAVHFEKMTAEPSPRWGERAMRGSAVERPDQASGRFGLAGRHNLLTAAAGAGVEGHSQLTVADDAVAFVAAAAVVTDQTEAGVVGGQAGSTAVLARACRHSLAHCAEFEHVPAHSRPHQAEGAASTPA